ncbi:hypothetical protein JW707_01425 [Candidatus Woesearchaeota archaeon]|nr:hypothetical protein [Candidatus Woesearchaeota archaeon]
MKYIYELANVQDYAVGYFYEHIEMFIYSAVCFFVPFFMGHPQLFVGIAVNAALVAAALNLRGYKLLPVIMLPSLGVLSRGIIFGPFSKFLVYMIPFIWAGNAILVFSFKYFRLKKNHSYAYTLAVGALTKGAFLFLSAFILYKLSIIPVVFLTAMGIIQVTTAISGGIAAYGIHYTKKSLAAR